MAGGGTFVTATGATISSVVGGAVTAGISALASQAAVALINNKGDIGGALDDLGSSANVKNLLTAIVTGGVLGGLNLNPTGVPTSGAGSQAFMTQLGQNLQAGAARAVIGTAINGGSLEDGLVEQLKTAFIDTFAAQGAHQIGDWTQTGALNDFTNKIAHAIAGCAIGAAKAGSSSGCGAGALGAAIGELSAELYGTQIDSVQFASMMAGIAAAMAGGDAAAINLASQTGANAAANNYLSHAQWKELADKLKNCKSTAECEQVRRAYAELSAKQDAEMRNACVDISSAACRQHLEVAAIGSQAQEELVKAGALPASYLGGNDLNAQARRTAINALAADIRRICNGDPQCAAKNQKGLTAVGSALLDFVPVIGDIKGFVEAETPFDYVLAAVGMTGPVGDGITKLLKEGKVFRSEMIIFKNCDGTARSSLFRVDVELAVHLFETKRLVSIF